MADIARRIKIYNQAFQLARAHIAKDNTLTDRAGIVKDLHDAIRREIAFGTRDVAAIAAAAVNELRARYGAGTPQSS
jgi:hypothetical protein